MRAINPKTPLSTKEIELSASVADQIERRAMLSYAELRYRAFANKE